MMALRGEAADTSLALSRSLALIGASRMVLRRVPTQPHDLGSPRRNNVKGFTSVKAHRTSKLNKEDAYSKD